MSNPLYRAERCRDRAEECHAIAALRAPSSERRTHYFWVEAEGLAELAYGR
jgi:hypothetical protein